MAVAPPTVRTDRRRARRAGTTRLLTPAFVTLAVASLAYFTAAGMVIVTLPRYVAGPLGGGSLAVGLVVGAFSVSAVLVRPVAGRLGDRRGRRPIMLAGAAIFATSVLAYGLAASPAALIGLRLVGGVGEALFFVGFVTACTDLAPEDRRGEAMSLASLALYVGLAAGPVLAEVVLHRAGFGATWLVAGAAGLLALVLVLRVRETAAVGGATPAARGTGGGRLVHPDGLLPGVVLLASIAGMAGFLTFVPLHALEIGAAGAGPAMATFAGVVVAVRSLGARLPDRLGPARAIRSALAVSALGLTVIAWWSTPVGLLAGAAVFGVGIALLTPSVFALAVARVRPDERAQVIGTTSAFLDLALGVGPVSMGFVAGSFGHPAVFLAGAGSAVAGLVLVVVTRLGGRR